MLHHSVKLIISSCILNTHGEYIHIYKHDFEIEIFSILESVPTLTYVSSFLWFIRLFQHKSKEYQAGQSKATCEVHINCVLRFMETFNFKSLS